MVHVDLPLSQLLSPVSSPVSPSLLFSSFFFLFLTAYENLFAYYASHHMGNRALAEAVDLGARFLFPVFHVASCIGLAIQVKNIRRTEVEVGNEL